MKITSLKKREGEATEAVVICGRAEQLGPDCRKVFGQSRLPKNRSEKQVFVEVDFREERPVGGSRHGQGLPSS